MDEKKYQGMTCKRLTKDTRIERYFCGELEPIEHSWDSCWSDMFFAASVELQWGNRIYDYIVPIGPETGLR